MAFRSETARLYACHYIIESSYGARGATDPPQNEKEAMAVVVPSNRPFSHKLIYLRRPRRRINAWYRWLSLRFR